MNLEILRRNFYDSVYRRVFVTAVPIFGKIIQRKLVFDCSFGFGFFIPMVNAGFNL